MNEQDVSRSPDFQSTCSCQPDGPFCGACVYDEDGELIEAASAFSGESVFQSVLFHCRAEQRVLGRWL